MTVADARPAPDGVEAWIGLLETHKQLTRSLDAVLDTRHGLSLSSLETLGRLAAAPGGRLGLSALAAATGLSRSRTTRICTALEERGLLERRRRADDSRAVDAVLTGAGAALVRAAQSTHREHVHEAFLSRLSVQERATLATIFDRFAPAAADRCSARAS